FRRRSRSLAREEFDDLVQECLAHWIVVRRKLAPDPDAPPVGAYSTPSRTPFRCDGGQHCAVMADAVPR
ncbi:hypothetical protein, partial [Thermomonas sp.]|uniref:hypothetical protein n=1 Tax=Thermomonas sp. TaxID=1971895 RepID=UPI0032209977